MKRRDTSLDIIRVLACFMVVLMHSPVPSENANGPFLSSLSYFTAPCIGLFFMVSGALLLPVKTDYFTFIRKRLSKILIPTILWSLIYIGLRLYNSESEINLLQTLTSIPFSAQGEGVLWFMYTLAGLYLLAPILSGWLDKAAKREIEIVLCLWCITLCYPILDFWLITNKSTTGILYYFTGYVGYFLLGYYIQRYSHSISLLACSCIALSGVLLLLALKQYNIPFDFYQLFWYESIFIAALGVVLYKGIINICKHLKICQTGSLTKIFGTISDLSFGIYLIHILIMRHWLWHQEWILSIANYPLQCVTITIITILLSIAVCHVISKLPKSEWIIGYHRKKNATIK